MCCSTGILAGDAGAIIGSRKEVKEIKIDEIKSETLTHDNRNTILSYFENGKRCKLTMWYDNFQVLEDLIPEKNYAVVSEVKKQSLVQQSVKVDEAKAITEQIKELAKLKDDGILTEEEFAMKKKELLAKM